MSTTARPLTTLVKGLQFPEAPRWREGRLWFSDFYQQRVFSSSLTGDLREEAHVPAQPSGLGWSPQGELLVVAMLDRRLLRRQGDSLQPVADLTALTGGPCNDMLVDPQGRAYVGNFGFDVAAREAPRATGLVRVDTNGQATVVASDLLFPNGMALTPDGRTLIVAETYGQRLTAFTVDAHGDLSYRRVWAHLPGCHPDGLCLDAEGAVWVADATGHAVLRVHAEHGVIDRISTSQRHAYACMLGGEAGNTLFICTAPGLGKTHAASCQGQIDWLQVQAPRAGLP
jgi:sugar lactone lactonase YvrE